MAIAKSNTNDLASLFKEGFFRIPPYQRRYSWELKQQKDLFDDLLEAFETKIDHFLGTLSLQLIEKKGLDSYYNIIDGQQRFTTLLLLYGTFAQASEDKRYIECLKINNIYFLEPINQEEKQFLLDLLDNKIPVPKTHSQTMMVQAVNEYKKRIKLIGKSKIIEFLDFMLNHTLFLIYLVDDYAASIRMFESINDRGMPLSYFDKLKSFFLYFSEKYLSRGLDTLIQESFDVIYSFFDNNNLQLEINTDETLLLYHYLSNPSLFKENGWAYTKSTQNIFLDFKKYVLEYASNPEIGKCYIQKYLEDIILFINSCLEIDNKIKAKLEYSEFYFLLKPGQRMYPLSIRLNILGILDETINMLEKIEFYLKYRRDPKKDIYLLLKGIIEFIGTKEDMLKFINNELYHIYSWQDKAIDIVNNDQGEAKYALYLFNKLNYQQVLKCEEYNKLQVEHIFSQNPSFPVENYGFDEKSYSQLLNNIGNFTLLEPELNDMGRAGNKPPKDKIREDYIDSFVTMTQHITLKNMKDIEKRNKIFEDFLDTYFYFEIK